MKPLYKFMKSFRATALFLIASTLISGHAFCQTSTMTAPTVAGTVSSLVARLTKLLTLNTAQATQATSLFTTEITAIQTAETNIATARTALATAAEANSATGIAAAAATIGTQVTAEELARGTGEAAFYAILTSAQQAIYKELLAAGLDCGAGLGIAGGGPGGRH